MSSEINRLLRLLFLAILLYAGNIAAQSGKADTAFINNLNAESFALLKENPDTAALLARKAIELSTPVNYLQGLGDGYVRLGIIAKDAGNYQQAIADYKKSLIYRLQIGDQDLIARVYNNIGMVFSKMAEYDSASFYLMKALKSAESLKLKSAQAMYSMNIGIAYEKNRDFELALKFNHQARALYEEEEDSTGVLKCLINEGGIWYAKKEYTSALPIYRRAIAIATILEDDRNRYYAIGDLATTFMSMDVYDSAVYYMKQSLFYHLEEEDVPAAAIDYGNLGILFGKMNKPDSAVYYLKQSLMHSEAIGDIQLSAKNAMELAVQYVAKGDFKEAYKYQQQYISYNDSVYSISKAEAIAEMQTQYETEKKENQIQLLNKDKEIQQQQLDRKSMMQLVLISGIVVLIVFFGLFFNRYKLKRTIQSQEALLKERKRISTELHDDLGAQLSTAKLYLSKIKTIDKNEDTKTIIDNSLSLIDGSITDLRRIMDDLQVSTLQDKGIIVATEELVNKVNHLQLINFSLSHHGIEKRLEYKLEHTVFRITQELINNTLKYAGASKVTLELLVRDDSFVVLYEDDGKGFDLQKINRGYGLSNVENRASSMGGFVEWDTRPGNGFRAIIEIPVSYATTKV
ncbi:MAG: Sensor protein VraS [Bacteroidetes bacterium ADurb.Bin397]|jgi:two-component system NarL family sensor kinase|nr:MAG: Sensor protein VraS [Bacteroidetes bacterium ADurb.Bin397]